jgi:hypothetical protein
MNEYGSWAATVLLGRASKIDLFGRNIILPAVGRSAAVFIAVDLAADG